MIWDALALVLCRVFGHTEPVRVAVPLDTARDIGPLWRYRCRRCGRQVP